jgi:hypothetical protein
MPASDPSTTSLTARRTTRRALVGVVLGAALLVGSGVVAVARPGRAESAAAAQAVAGTVPQPRVAPDARTLGAALPTGATKAAQATALDPADIALVDRLTEREVPADPVPLACPATGRAAVADKTAQRFWLCRDGVAIVEPRPMTTGPLDYGLPPVGIYPVFAKLERNRSETGELLERFVAFYRTPRNGRIAFHQYVNQDPATLGDPTLRVSAGCFRVSVEDSWLVWDFLQIGDPVYVISP